ncbi:substrate-binding domain-containing protein [Halomonas alkaliantarctica]|nr:substrate-binding domain-containing protein [Halomonas alkaliantarctica]
MQMSQTMPSPRAMRWGLILLGWLMALWVTQGQASGATEPAARVGFAQDTLANDWRWQQVQDVKAVLDDYPAIEFVHTNAEGSVALQAQQIRRLADTVDVLIVSPRAEAVLSQVIAEVYNAGTPVIVLSRGLDNQRFTSFIRPSNTIIGRAAAQHLTQALGGAGTILMLEGLEGVSTTQQRSQSFAQALAHYPNIALIVRTANFLRVDALRAVQELMAKGVAFDAIYAQSDSMAVGARMAMTNAGLDPSAIPIVGIDYIQEAQEALLNGTQSASFTYPTGGGKAAEFALRLLQGEPVPKHWLLPTVKVTADNAEDVEPIF